MNIKQNGFIKIALIISVLIGVVVSGYAILIKKTAPIALNDQKQNTTPSKTSSLAVPLAENPVDDTANWKKHVNNEDGFSFLYPSQVSVLESEKVITIQDSQSFFQSQVRIIKGIKTFRWSRIGNVYYFDNNNSVIRKDFGKTDPVFSVSGLPVFAFTAGDAGSYFVEYGVVSFDKDEILLFGLSSDSNSPEPILAKFAVFESILNKIIKTVSFK